MNKENLLDHHQEEVVPVSKGLRFVNFLIDTIITYAFTILILKTLTLSGEAFTSKSISGLFFLLIWPASTLYYVVTEHLWGKTIGKLITGTKVVTDDGRVPTLRNIIFRSLARLIPINPFSFFMDENGWHDSMTGTAGIRS